MATPDVSPALLISMQNNCGFGTPTLMGISKFNTTLATNTTAFSTTTTLQANAYLDDGGQCSVGGSGCSIVSIIFRDSAASASIAVDPPYGFTTPVGFEFVWGSCDEGYECLSAECLNDGPATVMCAPSEETVLQVTFCPFTATIPDTSPPTLSSVPAPAHATSKHSVPIAAIVGGTVGGLAFLLFVATAAFFVNRRRQTVPPPIREKIEFRTRLSHRRAEMEVRSSSPAGWSVSGEEPMKVDYSDSMAFRELPSLEKAQL